MSVTTRDESSHEEIAAEYRELMPGASLPEVTTFAFGLTFRRNDRQFPSLLDRTSHLADGGGELLDTIRIENTEVLPRLGAKILMRIFNVLQGMGENPTSLIDAVIEKYYCYTEATPDGACCYCGQKPCVCGTDKAATKPARTPLPHEIRTKIAAWTLSDWQHYFAEVYGPNNRARGLDFVRTRVATETLEANSTVRKMKGAENAAETAALKHELLLELADVFAWLLGLYNAMDGAPSLDEAFVARYSKGCPKCGKYPCECGRFDYVADRKSVQ